MTEPIVGNEFDDVPVVATVKPISVSWLSGGNLEGEPEFLLQGV